MGFVYKIAETAAEFKEIHELNYRTFVEEIPQHKRDASRMLKDKFHEENTYIICLKDDRVVGMIALRSDRPFSLDGKIGDVEQHLPFRAKNLVEIRLLSIERKYRNGRAFLGLAQALIRYCLKKGYDAALISGTTREQKLYRQLGFIPFAKLTGTTDAAFQPMYLTKKAFNAGVAGRLAKPFVNFLPGPATMSEDVKEAMLVNPFSHRSAEFKDLLVRVKQRLLTLTHANNVQILHGTGTLANDVVAAQLSVQEGRGLILVNGEFGERLIDHASCFGLAFDTIKMAWGAQFDESRIAEMVQKGHYKWLWAVHCETSTGVVNDIVFLKKVCKENGLFLAIDSVSSLGSIRVNLEGVTFATGVSGKGLSSYTGLAFVFHQEMVQKSPRLPRYLDLGAYADAKSIPYTQSSNLMMALDVALMKYEQPEEVYNRVSERMRTVKACIEEIGLPIVNCEKAADGFILTMNMTNGRASNNLGDNLYLNGYTVHYESLYLMKRNWLQISCMNDVTSKEVTQMLDVMKILIATTKKGDDSFERIIDN